MNKNTNLVPFSIAGVKINQDADGRYCLNDLHKAAGGDDFPQGNPIHRPGEFIRLQQTQELVAELESAGIPAIKITAGRFGGSFSVKELVYAYANWISPAFYLKVIRTFDAVVTGNHEALTAAQYGGITKAVVHKQIEDALRLVLPALVHGEIARQQTMVRNGETAGQVWKRWRLETKGMRGYPTWFGNRLAAAKCQIEGRAAVGGIASRLFDPDKCDSIKARLRARCLEYIAFRLGQGRFDFDGEPA